MIAAVVVFYVIVAALVFLAGRVSASTIRYSSARNIVAPQLPTSPVFSTAIADFNFTQSPVEVSSGAVSGQTNVNDVLYNTNTSAGVVTTCLPVAPAGAIYSSTNTSIGTINSSTGVTTYVGNGTVQFNARYGQVTKAVNCLFNNSISSTNTFSGYYTTGSLAQFLFATTTARVTGVTPSASTYNIYSSVNDTTKVYVRNNTLFASTTHFDLTPIPAYNSAGSGSVTGSGILVAKDIVLGVAHTCPSGTTYFVTSTSTTISRNVVDKAFVSGADICLMKLDSDVPSTITPAKVFAAGAVPETKMTTVALNYDLMPVLYTNQFRILRIGVLNTTSNLYSVGIIASTTSPIRDWYSNIVPGDSGTPVFTSINGQTVAIGTWSFSSGQGFYIPNYISQINATMTALGSPYQLSTIDLSGFPSY